MSDPTETEDTDTGTGQPSIYNLSTARNLRGKRVRNEEFGVGTVKRSNHYTKEAEVEFDEHGLDLADFDSLELVEDVDMEEGEVTPPSERSEPAMSGRLDDSTYQGLALSITDDEVHVEYKDGDDVEEVTFEFDKETVERAIRLQR